MTPRSHGTPARYSHGPDEHDQPGKGCRCIPCRAALAAAARYRSREKAYGRWQPYTDAGPVREHVRSLQASGLGWRTIAALAGVPRGTVSSLLYGNAGTAPSAGIRPANAAALLAVRPALDTLPATVRTGAAGTARRVRALVACGWSLARLARRLGTATPHIRRLADGQIPQVTVATALAVRALYDDLWNRPPPAASREERQSASRARNYARVRGWPGPGWWDDNPGPHFIDDPDACPAPGWKRQEVA